MAQRRVTHLAVVVDVVPHQLLQFREALAREKDFGSWRPSEEGGGQPCSLFSPPSLLM
jgi:hypothetical protein